MILNPQPSTLNSIMGPVLRSKLEDGSCEINTWVNEGSCVVIQVSYWFKGLRFGFKA